MANGYGAANYGVNIYGQAAYVDAIATINAASAVIAGGGTEVSGNGYTRKAMAFDAASAGASDNTSAVEFDTATGSWGTITHTAVLDAATSGNMLMENALTASKAIANGDVFRFQAGEFDVTLT